MTIKQYIRKYVVLKITSGEWTSGTKIPSENGLALKFNCSRITARQALAPLVYSGFLTAKKGQGYAVSELNKDINLTSFTDRYEIVKTTIREVDVIPEWFRELLNLTEKDRIFGFIKEYYDKEGLLAGQLTVLNNDFIWSKNLEGFRKSITKELAKQGSAIYKTDIRVTTKFIPELEEVKEHMPEFDIYPKEIIKSYSDDAWIEATVRIVRPDKLNMHCQKRKY